MKSSYLSAVAALVAAAGLQAQITPSAPSIGAPTTVSPTSPTGGIAATRSQAPAPNPITTTPSTSSPSNLDIARPPISAGNPLNDRFTTVPPSPAEVGNDNLRTRSTFPSSRDWETGAGAPASGEVGVGSGRLTPPPNVNPQPQPLQGAGPTGSPVRGSSSVPTSPTLGTSATSPTLGTSAPSPVIGTSATSPTLGTSATSPLNNPKTTPTLGIGNTSPSTELSKTVPGTKPELNTTGIPAGTAQSVQPLDRAMTAKLRAQLSQSPRPGMTAISPETVKGLNIRTDKGRVILQGEVENEAMRDAIIRSASQVPGIGDIDDRLTVQNRPDIGAPAGAQTGQSPQIEPDLNDRHPELIPQP